MIILEKDKKLKKRLTARNPRLLELVDKQLLKKILSSFTSATGLRANIVDTEGRSIFGFMDAQKNCDFCQLIWQYQRGIERCQSAYTRAGKQAAKFGEPYIFRCPAGLIEWAAPLIINGEYLGSIICGQVLMWEPEKFFWVELHEMNKCLGEDLKPLIEAAKGLEVVSAKKIQAAADLLFVTANYIMKAGWESLRNRQEISCHQALLAEEIANRKTLEAQLTLQREDLNAYLSKERELVSMIKLGDKESAAHLLHIILADFFITSGGNISLIKARVLELVVIMSRAAVEGGANFDQTLNVNNDLVSFINNAHTTDEITLAASQSLVKFMDELTSNSKVKNRHLINEVKNFIRKNYPHNITLEEISNFVFLSPGYLSKIFKEELGCTVMEYVTRVRIEEAKKMLLNTMFNIDEISEKLGYSDPSYFAKVFRRTEGISPREFRKQA